MKQKIVKIDKLAVTEELNIKSLQFKSDFFKCSVCGYTVRMRVLGDTATCSQCGGRMYRI